MKFSQEIVSARQQQSISVCLPDKRLVFVFQQPKVAAADPHPFDRCYHQKEWCGTLSNHNGDILYLTALCRH